MREEEISGMDEINNTEPEDPEAEMNAMFDQSILDPNGQTVGRLSIAN